MGRYYGGDIEGKFWVGVQSSNDPSFFGGTECEPHEISYEFEQEDLKDVLEGIKECENKLGKYKKPLDKFFNGKGKKGYNDEMIIEELEITKEKVKELLEWYARLELGIKIKDCIEKTDHCYFDAEL